MRRVRVGSALRVEKTNAGSDDHMTQTQKKARLQDEIDQNLKRAYDDVLKEDVPERFTQLLDKLRARDASNDNGNGHTHDK